MEEYGGFLILDAFAESEVPSFDDLYLNTSWTNMIIRDTPVPRKFSFQTEVVGKIPLYRHSANYVSHPIPYSTNIQRLVKALRRKYTSIGENTAILQLYMNDSKSSIGEHADKSLDTGENGVYIYSLGATRRMIFRKKDIINSNEVFLR